MTTLLLVAALLAQSGHFERGMELAQAEQWTEARQELEAGAIESPADKRFPIELAGIAYREGDTGLARRRLHQALTIDPSDAYANDFLATLYLLENNYPAAIKYLNRVNEPRIEFIETTPPPPLDQLLYDRAFAIAPGEILTLDKFRTTEAWIASLDVLGSFRTELTALPIGSTGAEAISAGNAVRPAIPPSTPLATQPAIPADPRYALNILWSPPTGYSKYMGTATGLFTQRLVYTLRNLDRKGATLDTEYRWDAQKRRLFLTYAGPFRGQPSARYRLYTDLRKETWNIGDPVDFRLRKAEFGGAIRFIPSGRLWWETGARVAVRDYEATGFASGTDVAYTLGLNYTLLDIPDRGLTVRAISNNDLGRFFSGGNGGLYSRHQVALESVWRPHPAETTGRQYEYRLRLGAGRIYGSAPFDELFILARQRDDGIPLRGHRGTHNGKKGAAPVGTAYMLMNFDFFRESWTGERGALDIGPLVDIGNVWRSVTAKSQAAFAVDVGIQARLRLTSGFSFIVSYGHDLRGNRGLVDFSMPSLR